MIYIIDDKKSRQEDYGWNEEKLSKFDHILTPIWGNDSLRAHEDNIFQAGNTILFHESFPQSDDFKKKLREHSAKLNIAYFSGSKGSRYVKGNICMLPPDVLYANLEVFIKNLREGTFNFKHLAFGENFALEELTRSRIIETIKQNRKSEKIPSNKTIFFAVTSSSIDYEIVIDPPFNIEPTRDWDLSFSDKDISDVDLDGLVNGWFAQEKYDAIYIPLCFGNVLSDYLGLRLAMHIRLTPTLNKTTPIFIYGVASVNELLQHNCFNILKAPSVSPIGCDNDSLINSLGSVLPMCDFNNELKFLQIEMPSNIGGHSLANQWGATVLAKAAGIDYEPTEEILNAQKSLYFKYVKAKTESGFPENDKKETINTKGKRILLIDDEAGKGWSDVFRKIFNGGYLDVVDGKLSGFNDIPEGIKQNIYYDLYDLYLIDLRLMGENEEHIVSTLQFSGRDVINEIKRNNEGNQVIVITASNKAWNMRNLLADGANGYYIKESPDLLLSPEFSKENFYSFKNDVEIALGNRYKRHLWAKSYDLNKRINNKNIDDNLQNNLTAQLNVFETFMLKANNENEIANTYLTLFQILEIIKHYYSPLLGKEYKSLTDCMYAILEEFGHLKGHQINNLDKVNNGRNNMVHKLNIPNATNYKTKEGLTTLFEVITNVISCL